MGVVNANIGHGFLSKLSRFWQPNRHSEFVEAELLQTQYKRVSSKMPVLYLALTIITFASSMAAQDDFSTLYQYTLPAIFLAVCLVRAFMWLRVRNQIVSAERAQNRLKHATISAYVITLAGLAWTLSAYFDTHPDFRAIVPIFALLACLCACNCLVSLPKAAFVPLVVCNIPLGLVMVAADQNLTVAVGLAILVATVLQIGLVINQYGEMVRGIELREEMKHLAETDVLTGLSNRRAFNDALDSLTTAGDEAAAFALVVIDLDGFKPVNDRYGHKAGDALLVEVATRLTQSAQPGDIVARIGGDEFALILTNPGKRSETDARIYEMLNVISAPYSFEMATINISASAGYACFPADAADSVALLEKADDALYAVKHSKYEEPQYDRRRSAAIRHAA